MLARIIGFLGLVFRGFFKVAPDSIKNYANPVELARLVVTGLLSAVLGSTAAATLIGEFMGPLGILLNPVTIGAVSGLVGALGHLLVILRQGKAAAVVLPNYGTRR